MRVMINRISSLSAFGSFSKENFHKILRLKHFWSFGLLCLTLLGQLSANTCVDLPQISGPSCYSCYPVGWSPVNGQGTPDMIQGDGVHPFGSDYVVSNIGGASVDGGAMGLFLDSSNSTNEGWTTTLSGLSSGTTYAITLQWQQATMVYTRNNGRTFSFIGGGLEIIVDGQISEFFGNGTAAGDDWQVAEVVFVANGSTATIAANLIDNSGTGTTTTNNQNWGNGGAIVIDAGSTCVLTACDLSDVNADCDDDGIINGEDCDPSDPNEQSDIDKDGICDGHDLDNDNDGILDVEECPNLAGITLPEPDAVHWTTGAFDLYAIGNNTTGNGAKESGFERAILFEGHEISISDNDWGVSGNIASFNGGSITLDDAAWEGGVVMSLSTSDFYQSGNNGNAVRMTPNAPVESGNSYKFDFTFDNPVEYFSFDWVDIFDFGNEGSTEEVQYSVFAENQLIAKLKGRVIGAGNQGAVSFYDENNVLRGTLDAGHNLETTIGFYTTSPVQTVTVVYESLTRITARDFHGIDRITFKGVVACDTDNDGTPDHLDLNSDGDNCIDAIEGGGTFRGTQASNDIENEMLSGPVDADGVPVSAGVAGQGAGDSKNAAVQSEDCACYLVSQFGVFETPQNIGLSEIENTWSASWGDFNNDGLVDLFTTNYDVDKPNTLYRNEGNNTFVKVNSEAITTDLASSLASSWGDFNNDGLLDLYVANNIGFVNFLYRNEGNGVFTRIQNDPSVIDKGYAHSTSWIDYDNDGFLDIFVADFFATRFNQLYHNNGDGTFEKVTGAAPVLEATSSVSGAWGDYNNDGYPDLFVSNTNLENNSLYKNLGAGRFEKITTGAIVNDGGQSVGASWGDYNNDGHLDLFVSNAGNQNNFLYTNDGNGRFIKETSGSIVSDGGHSHGSAWADYDNDGDLDLYVSNDSGNDNFLYRNDDGKTFTRVNNEMTNDSGNSFGAAWADYDNDGDVDLYVANHDDGANFLYENLNGECQANLCVSLVGTNSNASGIGAKIKVKANVFGMDTWQTREVTSQTGGGVGGQSELKALFGLGNAAVVDSILVIWPSGYRQVVEGQAVDDCITIREESGSEVCGTAFYDENNNCVKDEGEVGLPNIELEIQPGGLTVFTDENGDYTIPLGIGSYVISQVEGGNWRPSCPTGQITHDVNVTSLGGEYCGFNFSESPTCSDPDLTVEVSATAHRIGFENMIAVHYENLGGEMARDIDLTVILDEKIKALEASIPWDSNNGNEFVWKIKSLDIGGSGTIYIVDFVANDAILGSNLSLQSKISHLGNDCDLSNNQMENLSQAIGALDPNDILVSPEGEVRNEEVLTYKIRFQNVGNSVVNQVVVEDQLPDALDVSTLEMGSASDPYRLTVSENGLLRWTFDNILLPDSTANEPMSHGYLTYRIKMKPNQRIGTRVENQANIFFDNNPPIITNTVLNIIVDKNQKPLNDGLMVTPNPVVDDAKIMIRPDAGKNPEKIYSIRLFNSSGQKVLEVFDVDKHEYYFSIEDSIPGMYTVLVRDINGKEYAEKIIVLK